MSIDMLEPDVIDNLSYNPTECQTIIRLAFVNAVRAFIDGCDNELNAPAGVGWKEFTETPHIQLALNDVVRESADQDELRKAMLLLGYDAGVAYLDNRVKDLDARVEEMTILAEQCGDEEGMVGDGAERLEQIKARGEKLIRVLIENMVDTFIANTTSIFTSRRRRHRSLLSARSHFDHMNQQTGGRIREIFDRNKDQMGDGSGGQKLLTEASWGDSSAPPETQEAVRDMLITFVAAGEQVFSIGPVMQDMFLHTDLGDFDPMELKLPYPTIYVATPGHERVHGFYLSQEDVDIRFLVFCHTGAEELYLGGHIRLSLLPSIGKLLDERLDKQILPDGKEVSEAGHADKKFASMMTANLLLYLDCGNSKIRVDDSARRTLNKALAKARQSRGRERARRRAMQRAMVRPGSTVTYVGGDIEEEVSDLRAAGTGRSPRPHRVRGHYRMQAHGHGRLLRKRIWIEPFYKHCEGSAAEPVERSEYRIRE